jgi:predicted SnoaL-like aldol condensation-catalyzing enzyme
MYLHGCHFSILLTNYALNNGLNTLVDGSLKDAVWYGNYFMKLRKTYPKLKICIIHVTAPTEAVFEHVQQQGKTTGQVVPLDTLQRSIEEVPKAVKQL